MTHQNCPDCRTPGVTKRPKHFGASHCTDCLRHFFVSAEPDASCAAPGCESPMLPGYCRQCVRAMPWALYTALRAALGNPPPTSGARPLSPTREAFERALARPDSPAAASLADQIARLRPSAARSLARAFERIDREKQMKADGDA